ncbi:MAG: DUF1080 domain-containing protein [Pirellulales bacterium]|nr:DUF1080 domain-containing protein [Pirellulales bacterium]
MSSLQGEYVGWVSGGYRRARLGLQLAATGQETYRATLLPGGLPGEGARMEEAERVETRASDIFVRCVALGHRVWITPSEARVMTPDGVLRGILHKTNRQSPSLGAAPPAEAIVIFDGTDTGELIDPMISKDGLLHEGSITRRNVRDFFLHAEFRIPLMPDSTAQSRGNSGLYLQRRYEVQILDSFGLKGTASECGGLYRQCRPDVNACLPPSVWQTYDIEFRAARYNTTGTDGVADASNVLEKTENARITVRHNGIVIHDDVELSNKTGAGLSEGPQSLPIWFQDHGDPVRFRNVWMILRGDQE